MKKLITLSFILMMISGIHSQAQTVKQVLFLGNSYTAVNDLPFMIFKAAQSTGDSLIYDSNTPGGYRLMGHASNSTSIGKIFSEEWDYVVLQAQSQEPSWGQAQMQTELFPHAKTLCDTIRDNHACSQPMFYMTWGRKNGDAMNCQYAPWVCTYEGMDSALRATYTYMAQVNHTEISPVGPVWRYIRNNHPNIELYSGDESHPSLAGSYAAACAFYTMIFKKDPTLISWKSTLAADVTDSIKMAAKLVVFDSLNYWDHTINPVSPDYAISLSHNILTVDNLNPDVDSILWNFGDGTTSDLNNDSHTYSGLGSYTLTVTAYQCGTDSTESITITVDSLVSVQEYNIDQNSVKVFPNPFSSSITIETEEEYQTLHISFISIEGKIALSENFANTSKVSLDTEMLSPGFYTVKIVRDNTHTISKKLIRK